jgi:hypothetical protein
MGWATFWATFSQAHLVTLITDDLTTQTKKKKRHLHFLWTSKEKK